MEKKNNNSNVNVVAINFTELTKKMFKPYQKTCFDLTNLFKEIFENRLSGNKNLLLKQSKKKLLKLLDKSPFELPESEITYIKSIKDLKEILGYIGINMKGVKENLMNHPFFEVAELELPIICVGGIDMY